MSKNEDNWNKLVTALIVAAAVIMVFNGYQISALSKLKAGSAGTQVDTTGWTANEKMNYEMHGTIPARAQASAGAQPAQPQMVGGC